MTNLPLAGKHNAELTWDDIFDAVYALLPGTPVQARLVMESDGIVANLRPLTIIREGGDGGKTSDGSVIIDFEIDETDDDEGEEPKAVA